MASSSSVGHNRGMRDLRYRNRNYYYFCNRIASIAILESDKNPGKLYATCATNRCNYFDWVYPENIEVKVPNCEGELELESKLTERVRKLEVEPLRMDIDNLNGRVASLEEIVNEMKILFKD